MTRLIQIQHPREGRKVARVEGDLGRLLDGLASVHELARAALSGGVALEAAVEERLSSRTVNYGAIHAGTDRWRLLPAFDHPEEPARCLVSGTGLTHRASAQNRQAMHGGGESEAPVTDSMRMYRWGLEGGRPAPGRVGVAPEWFYKGCGTILRGCGEPLQVPPFAGDGGEEPEVAGAYLIGPDGRPRRVGFTAGNEFSDHVTEKKNYLYLAPSKLRDCAIGPELIVNGSFDAVPGVVAIERGGETVWSRSVSTGEAHMSHTLENMEHHHFKYPAHRRPGDVHIHFFGADAFSFGEGVSLRDGDVMVVAWEGFGRPLRNPIRILREEERIVKAEPL